MEFEWIHPLSHPESAPDRQDQIDLGQEDHIFEYTTRIPTLLLYYPVL